MLDTLEKKVDPRHTALIVVDVQNDFCAPKGMMDREGRDLSLVQAMVPRLTKLIDAAREAGALIVYIQSIYGVAGNEYLSEPWLEQASRRRKGSYTKYPVCARGSWNGEFYDGIAPIEGEVIVNKHRFDAFEGTDLDLILRSKGIRSVIMTGVATNVCVETTARSAFVKDYYIVFVGDCTGAYSREEHEMTLRNMDKYFGQVVNHDEIVASWEAGRTGARPKEIGAAAGWRSWRPPRDRGNGAVTATGGVVVRHWEDDHLRLPLVEGEGEARALLWPGVGSTQRALHHFRLAPGQRTVVLAHPDSEAVYYVAGGRGLIKDLDEQRAETLLGGKVVLVTPATRYRLVAETELVVVGGPCPVDTSLYLPGGGA